MPNGNATFQQEGTDLVDDAGALAHQPLSHAVHRLKVELVGGLGRDELDPPRPGSFCGIPRLPSRIAGITEHLCIERPPDNVRRSMHGDGIGKSRYAISGHQRCQQPSMFGTVRNSVKSNSVS